MLKFNLMLVSLVTALTMAACSDKTQENAKETVNSAGKDAASAVVKTGDIVENGAAKTVSAVANTGKIVASGVATVGTATASAVVNAADNKAGSNMAVSSATDVPEKQQY